MQPEESLQGRLGGLTVQDLLKEEALFLDGLTGPTGLDREITSSSLFLLREAKGIGIRRKPAGGVTMLGRRMVEHLNSMGRAEIRKTLLHWPDVALVTAGQPRPSRDFAATAKALGLPLLWSRDHAGVTARRLSTFLEERIPRQRALHGVLMLIQGVGVLIIGESGIGKSECALDLVHKGHRLVADDVVFLNKTGRGTIIGYSREPIKNHMEIRGLGIINIRHLFGVIAVADLAPIDLVVEMVNWKPQTDVERLGLDEVHLAILGVKIPRVVIPVSPGRNLSVILEVAVRNHLLKKSGYHAVSDLVESIRVAASTAGGVTT
jgi:HPr kinase/phosphorylase